MIERLKTTRHARFLAVVLVAWPLTGNAGEDADAIERGRKLAETHCARCHVIGDFNKFGGLGSTPSFQLLAGLKDGMERFRTFYGRRPHPAFVRVPDVPKWSKAPAYAIEFTVTPESIEDILAFVDTIEKRDLNRVPIVGGFGPNARQRIKGGN